MNEWKTLDPATDQLVETFDAATDADLEHALEAAHTAFRGWRKRSFDERATHLAKLGAILEARADDLAVTMALEMGKPKAQGIAEAKKCAGTCAFFAEHAAAWLAPETRPSDASRSYVRFDPLGVILAVMPWNFPLWQVIRFAAPSLMAGNAIVLKHAPNVPRTARAIEQMALEAGLPAGLLSAPFLSLDQTARAIADRRVAACTLTGSERAGASVAATAGKALKKAVLELGGSDPFIILEDADIARAAEVAAEARLINSGQSCIAAKRFIAVAPVFDAFVEGFVAAMAKKKVAPPLEAGCDVGPMARIDLRDTLVGQRERSIAKGAKIAFTGQAPEGPGAWFAPTILTGVEPGMAAFDEETFGPLAAVIRAGSEEEAIALANHSSLGLASSIWTGDLARAERIAVDIEAGSVFINAMVKSDPRLPFGGIKKSGVGREIGKEGLRELVNAKTVYLA